VKLRDEERDDERESNSQKNWIGSSQIHAIDLCPDWNATARSANFWLLLASGFCWLCFDFLNVFHF
jgi:hypothetical protein